MTTDIEHQGFVPRERSGRYSHYLPQKMNFGFPSLIFVAPLSFVVLIVSEKSFSYPWSDMRRCYLALGIIP